MTPSPHRRHRHLPWPISSLSPPSLNSLTSPSFSPSLSIASTRSVSFVSVFSLFISLHTLFEIGSCLLFLNEKEPELLRVDAERIQRQMQEVAVGNYRAFIAAADALVAIKEEVSSIDKHLESLVITSLPQFNFHIFTFLCSGT